MLLSVDDARVFYLQKWFSAPPLDIAHEWLIMPYSIFYVDVVAS